MLCFGEFYVLAAKLLSLLGNLLEVLAFAFGMFQLDFELLPDVVKILFLLFNLVNHLLGFIKGRGELLKIFIKNGVLIVQLGNFIFEGVRLCFDFLKGIEHLLIEVG
jgi:hypothetical protein